MKDRLPKNTEHAKNGRGNWDRSEQDEHTDMKGNKKGKAKKYQLFFTKQRTVEVMKHHQPLDVTFSSLAELHTQTFKIEDSKYLCCLERNDKTLWEDLITFLF